MNFMSQLFYILTVTNGNQLDLVFGYKMLQDKDKNQFMRNRNDEEKMKKSDVSFNYSINCPSQ